MENMIAVITVLTSGAAFCRESGEQTQESTSVELARILRALAARIEARGTQDRLSSSLYDINGNKVGTFDCVPREHVTIKITA